MSTPPQPEESAETAEQFHQQPIDGPALKNLASAALTWLRTNHEIVNALNVFPVPDGDTGTNMVLTMQSAFDEIENSPEKHAGNLANDLHCSMSSR